MVQVHAQHQAVVIIEKTLERQPKLGGLRTASVITGRRNQPGGAGGLKQTEQAVRLDQSDQVSSAYFLISSPRQSEKASSPSRKPAQPALRSIETAL